MSTSHLIAFMSYAHAPLQLEGLGLAVLLAIAPVLGWQGDLRYETRRRSLQDLVCFVPLEQTRGTT